MAVALRFQVHFDWNYLAHASARGSGLAHFPGSQGLKSHLNRIAGAGAGAGAAKH